MIKEFEVNDILNAVTDIFKINKKRNKNNKIEKVVSDNIDDLTPSNQAKSNESEILVLDQMIE
jgi:hypothetical protein